MCLFFFFEILMRKMTFDIGKGGKRGYVLTSMQPWIAYCVALTKQEQKGVLRIPGVGGTIDLLDSD